MPHLILPLLVIVVLIAVIAAMGAAMKRQAKGGTEGAADGDDAPAADYDGYVRKRYLFSPAEFSFYKVLLLAIGTEYSIQSKVRLADLIDVRKGSARWPTKFSLIAQKHLDFVLCEPKTMVPVVGIELDDRSHDSAKGQNRDGFVNGLLGAVGMPLLRVPAARGYEVQEIKAMVERALAAKAA